MPARGPRAQAPVIVVPPADPSPAVAGTTAPTAARAGTTAIARPTATTEVVPPTGPAPGAATTAAPGPTRRTGAPTAHAPRLVTPAARRAVRGATTAAATTDAPISAATAPGAIPRGAGATAPTDHAPTVRVRAAPGPTPRVRPGPVPTRRAVTVPVMTPGVPTDPARTRPATTVPAPAVSATTAPATTAPARTAPATGPRPPGPVRTDVRPPAAPIPRARTRAGVPIRSAQVATTVTTAGRAPETVAPGVAELATARPRAAPADPAGRVADRPGRRVVPEVGRTTDAGPTTGGPARSTSAVARGAIVVPPRTVRSPGTRSSCRSRPSRRCRTR